GGSSRDQGAPRRLGGVACRGSARSRRSPQQPSEDPGNPEPGTQAGGREARAADRSQGGNGSRIQAYGAADYRAAKRRFRQAEPGTDRTSAEPAGGQADGVRERPQSSPPGKHRGAGRADRTNLPVDLYERKDDGR